MLYRLTYFSECDHSAPDYDRDIEAILASARRNNPRQHITGALCFDRRHFIQVLEGGKHELTTLFLTIAADRRHRALRLVQFTRIHRRAFGRFAMAYIPETARVRAHVIEHCATDVLDPDVMEPDTIVALIHGLADELG